MFFTWALFYCSNVKITSAPEEVDVLINGVLKGKTPLSLNLDAGTYKITLNKTGFKSVDSKIHVSESRDLNKFFELISEKDDCEEKEGKWSKNKCIICKGAKLENICWEKNPAENPKNWKKSKKYCKKKKKRLPTKSEWENSWAEFGSSMVKPSKFGYWSESETNDPSQAWLFVPAKSNAVTWDKSNMGLALCVEEY
jgi:hypothetical protein